MNNVYYHYPETADAFGMHWLLTPYLYLWQWPVYIKITE